MLISAGIAFRIGDPGWCALVLPRSGLGHREGLVLGNAVGLIDADYEGTCLISAWNRNPARSGAAGEGIVIRPGDRIAQLVFTRVGPPAIHHRLRVRRGRAPAGRGAAAGRFRLDRHRCRLSKRRDVNQSD